MFYILLLLSDETVRKGLNRGLLQTRRTWSIQQNESFLSLSLAIIWLYSWNKFYFSFLKSICQVKVETTAMTMGCHHLSSSTQCAWRLLPIVMMAGAWEQILKAAWRPWQREKKWRKVALEAALCLVAMCISSRPLPLIFFSHWP